jgi:hypothetical protein
MLTRLFLQRCLVDDAGVQKSKDDFYSVAIRDMRSKTAATPSTISRPCISPRNSKKNVSMCCTR